MHMFLDAMISKFNHSAKFQIAIWTMIVTIECCHAFQVRKSTEVFEEIHDVKDSEVLQIHRIGHSILD